MSTATQLAIIFGSAAIAYIAGILFGNSIRMKEHGWKLGFVLATVAFFGSMLALIPIKQSIDLRGGVILVYEVNEEKTRTQAEDSVGDDGSEEAAQGSSVDMGTLITALSRRINPGGVREVVIRPYGSKQVEIIIPDVSDVEIKQIKNDISQTGFLNFRIVALESRNTYEWELAETAMNSDDPDISQSDIVRDGEGRKVGEWVEVGREERPVSDGSLAPYRFSPQELSRFLTRELVPGKKEIFVLYDETFDVNGGHLRNIGSSVDRTGNPSVSFNMTPDGSVLFGGLTSSNLPDANGKAPLGIVMDNELISAPVINSTISSNGVIEGRFTQKEVDSLVRVLRSGKLPAVLYKDPISENKVNPLLGLDTIRKGKLAIAASLIAVLIFMALYYRFAGIVACLALVANIILTLGLLVMLQAALSLPGLAGLVLTVGMSVDANVLIFERIREELKKGAALRMAIRNGFGRATSTIVDANLTSLITAIVLYVCGTETIKGFAIMLILGILTSLYTAIFCSRVIFDIAERKKWITKLNMTQALGETNFNFLGMRKFAAAVSLGLILLGLGAVFARGNDILDIDFTGGTSVTMKLNESMSIADVRSALGGITESVTVTEVRPDDADPGTVYKVDTDLDDERELQDKVIEILNTKLKTHSLDFSAPVGTEAQGSLPSAAADVQVNHAAPSVDDQSTNSERPTRSLPSPLSSLNGMLLAQADDAESAVAEAVEVADEVVGEVVQPETAAETVTLDEPVATEVAEEVVAEVVDEPETVEESAATEAAEPEATTEPATTPAAAPATPPTTPPINLNLPASSAGDASSGLQDLGLPSLNTQSGGSRAPLRLKYQSQSTLTFDETISAQSIEAMISDSASELGMSDPRPKAYNEDWDGVSSKGFKEWDVRFTSNSADTGKILGELESNFSSSPVWLSSSKIGSKVAGDMKTAATFAIAVSLLGIVGYIWVRFQKIGFGLAAVVALVHDVAIALGAIALSAWLAKPFGFMLIDEFRISLPIVAAFLTIIGYSLNDTIVVFDRIREVKGKSPDLTEDMINKSINQTLSRTLLTSVTTLIVVIILYVFGGQGIHGFAFALLIGVLVGTYSSIFVASPALLWLTGTKGKNSKKSGGKKKQRVGAA